MCGPAANEVIASCDHSVSKDKCSVLIHLTLNVVKDPGPDRRLAEGIKFLFLSSGGLKKACLITEEGVKLSAVDYRGGNALQDALVCRVITRSSHENVRAALVSECLPRRAGC